MNNITTKQELDRVIEAYNQYHNIKKTSISLGFSRSKTRKLLTTAGICFSSKAEKILNLYNQGYSVKQISDKLKLSIKTINEYVPYHTINNSDSTRSKKTIANIKSIQRKKALENPSDTLNLLKAFSEHRLYKYIYSDQGILINGELISFDDPRIEELMERIVYNSTKKRHEEKINNSF